jgi:8-oxo-dGTP pyrophosphatase MutT (NUDIX family)
MRGKSLAEAAAQEAYEEAGVGGLIEPRSIGRFKHRKRSFFGSVQVEVLVHALEVQQEFESWPEKGQRTRRWFPAATAKSMVQSPELSRLIGRFDRRATVRAR